MGPARDLARECLVVLFYVALIAACVVFAPQEPPQFIYTEF
jgi:hypothetical protein